MPTTKILVVDDEPDLELLIRQRFRQQIRQKEYEFLFARDGTDAYTLIQGDPGIEVILTDIMMPGMDGLTLLAKIRENNRFLQPVVVSAYGDLPNIRMAMNRGAFDFLTKPIDFNDFEITLAKTIRQTRANREAEQVREQLTQFQQELSIAADIQRSFMPAGSSLSLPGMSLHAAMLPARVVGGDFYDFFQVDENHLGLVVGDVSGKGMSSALLMTVSRTILRTIALQGAPPGECLTEVNRCLCRDNRSDLFVTVFYALVDLRTGELDCANAGHPPGFRVDSKGTPTALMPLDGVPLGFWETTTYETARTGLQSGDSLVLYTDGLTEGRNNHGDFFGVERLQTFLEKAAGAAPETLVQAIVKEIQAFTGNTSQTDDLTVLVGAYSGLNCSSGERPGPA
jgi:phosphoserine phosphatase RsbU/P